MNVFRWIPILPQLADVVGETVQALQNGKVGAAEAQRLSERILAIVAAVA